MPKNTHAVHVVSKRLLLQCLRDPTAGAVLTFAVSAGLVGPAAMRFIPQ